MDGIHDLGGKQGFGAIDRHDEDEAFHAAWEERVLGMVKTMATCPDWSIDWFRHCREMMEPVDYLTRPYYDQWLQTYIAMMLVSGALAREEIESGKASGPATSASAPMTPEKAVASLSHAANFAREAPAPSFAVGEAVRARRFSHAGHCRLPAYVRGRPGRIESVHGAHLFADAVAAGEKRAEAIYTVAFDAAELWPGEGAPGDEVLLDLWESYLERP